jgi:hypothetical protein
MRGDMVKMLLSEAKKRPEIAELVGRAGTLTDAEIAAAKVPLPWFRIALRRLRDQHGADQLWQLIERFVVDSVAPDPPGWLHIWQGGAVFLPLGRETAMDVRDGEPLFLPDTGGFWLATAFSPNVPSVLVSGSRRDRRETKSGYTLARRAWIEQSSSGLVTTIDQQQSVRFFRPG